MIILKIVNDREKIDEIAKQNKFDVLTVEKVLNMFNILYEISRSEMLSKDFALMGGSAIVFLYGNIYRLSVDLDLDYVGNSHLGRHDHDEILETQRLHIKEFRNIAKKLSYELEEMNQNDDRFLQLKYNYKSVVAGNEQSVELDLGYRYCQSVLGVKTIQWPNVFNFDNFPNFSVQTLPPEELWASKINAMVSADQKDNKEYRYLGGKYKIRHLYDVWFFIKNILKGGSIDKVLLKSLVLLFGMTRIEQYEFTRGEVLSLYSEDDYNNNLLPVIITPKLTSPSAP